MQNFINLKRDTNVIYLFFMQTAANCIPNRDGITGDIRTEDGRCVVSRESFNQNIKNGLAISHMIAPLPGCELLSVKNAYSEPLSLAQAQKSLMSRIALSLGCKPEELTPEDIFLYHDNIENTIHKFMDKSQDWFNNFGENWIEYVD